MAGRYNGLGTKLRKDHEDSDYLEESEEACCDDPNIDSVSGDKVCLNCGSIVGKLIVGDERRTFNNDEISSRKTHEPKWNKVGPRTMIETSKLDSRGKPIDPKKKPLYDRLSKMQHSLVPGERNLWH